MDAIYVFLEFIGEWKKVDSGAWEWIGNSMTRGFRINRSITLLGLVETIYEKTNIDRNKYAIEVTHKRISEAFCKIAPTLILIDSDVSDLIFLYENERAITLHAVLKENQEKRKAICLSEDDSLATCLGEDDGLAICLYKDCGFDNNDSYDNEEGGFVDDYFRCQVTLPNPKVTRCVELDVPSNQKLPLQIIQPITSCNPTPIMSSNPVPIMDSNSVPIIDSNPTPIICSNSTPIICSDPTPEEILHEEVPNRGDNLVEESDDVPDEAHNSPSPNFDFVEDVRRFNSLGSLSNGRHDGSNLSEGQQFESKVELNIKLSLVSIKGKFEMKVKKSTKTLKEVVCINEENCSWRVRARQMPGSNFFVIRQYNGLHTCSLMSRSIHHRQASSRVIGARMHGHFKDNTRPPNPKTLMGIVREELEVQVSYWKAWKGRQFAQKMIRETPEHSFVMLPSYCHLLKQVNPGSVTHIEVDSENKFLYFFMALGAAINGFKYMRKVISIDGSWIKNKYKGVLMVATTQDSEYHSYPIAWGLGDTENNKSWTWFLEKLKELIPDSPELCFISDRNQGIQNAVRYVYPMAHHGACYFHVGQNIKAKFKSCGSLPILKNAAEAYRTEVFHKHFDDIRQKYPRVAKYLEEEVGFEKWYRAHFKGNRYEVMTTNIVETVNNMMREAREYPITAMIDFILMKMGKWFYDRRREALAVNGPLTPMREETLKKRWNDASSFVVHPLNENEYNVMCTSTIKDTSDHIDAMVNLETRTCPCRVFDIDKIPCIHAIAAAGNRQPLNTESLVYSITSEYYRADYRLLAYAETTYPVPPESQWGNIPEEIKAIKVLEPDVYKVRGRPRLTCFRSKGEIIRKKYKCKACGRIGHNAKKCPNPTDSPNVTSTNE